MAICLPNGSPTPPSITSDAYFVKVWRKLHVSVITTIKRTNKKIVIFTLHCILLVANDYINPPHHHHPPHYHPLTTPYHHPTPLPSLPTKPKHNSTKYVSNSFQEKVHSSYLPLPMYHYVSFNVKITCFSQFSFSILMHVIDG